MPPKDREVISNVTKRTSGNLPFILDDHHFDDRQGGIAVDFEFLLESIEELLLLIFDDAIGKNNVAGVGKNAVTQLFRQGGHASVERGGEYTVDDGG